MNEIDITPAIQAEIDLARKILAAKRIADAKKEAENAAKLTSIQVTKPWVDRYAGDVTLDGKPRPAGTLRHGTAWYWTCTVCKAEKLNYLSDLAQPAFSTGCCKACRTTGLKVNATAAAALLLKYGVTE